MKKYFVLISVLSIALLLMSCGKKPEIESETGRMNGSTTDTDNSKNGTGVGDQGVNPIDITGLVTIYFDFDRYVLRDDARSSLRKNYEFLKGNKDASVLIEGHCDERGTVEYNLALGEKRARTAMDYLADLGISRDRMSVVSFGKERPAAPGSSEEAWAQNRRAEFKRQ